MIVWDGMSFIYLDLVWLADFFPENLPVVGCLGR